MSDNHDSKIESERILWEFEKRQNTKKMFYTVLRLYLVFGFVIGLFGIAYFIFITLNIRFNNQQQVALLISGVGISLSISSWVVLKIKRERKIEELDKIIKYQSFTDFIWKWSGFEEVSKKILSFRNRKFNKFSIREVVELLLKDETIDNSDAHFLEEAMRVRNAMVHGGIKFPMEIIVKYSERIEEITNKILYKLEEEEERFDK